MDGLIFAIKQMALGDGPGLRTTVFLKGCPLRCRWCHNPEGLLKKPQLMVKTARCTGCGLCQKGCSHPECAPFGRCLHCCPQGCLTVSGSRVTPARLAKTLLRDEALLNQNGGGVTFSGGEPLFQPEFLTETLSLLKGRLHRCIETAGYAPPKVFLKVLTQCDFVIIDLKLASSAAHLKYTGVANTLILQNFALLKNSGKPFLVRTPLIPGITNTAKNLADLQKIIGSARWEQLPYNALAGAKYQSLNMQYSLTRPQQV